MFGLIASLVRVRRLDFGEEASLVQHLDELRRRLMVVLFVAGIVFVVAFWRKDDLFALLNHPLPRALQKQGLTTTEIGEPFTITLTVAFYATALVTLPLFIYQLYAFIIPAASADVARRMRPMLLFVPLLFTVGVAFGYLFIIGPATGFLFGFGGHQFNEIPRAKSVYPLEAMIMFVMGAVFEMPAAVWVLARIGIINAGMMRRNRRVAIVIMAVLAAALPTTDIVSMLLELGTILALYEISIFVAASAGNARNAVRDNDDDG